MRAQTEPRHTSAHRKARASYLRELFGSLAIYIVLLLPSIFYGRELEPGAFKTALLTCPMIGFVMMIWAIARHFRRIDEYQRLIMLETFALAAALTAALTFTYGFMENAGYPRLSMFSVWGVMCSSWVVVGVVRYWKTCR